MIIIDNATQTEITNPDLDRGYIVEMQWASKDSYDSIDNVTKFSLDDDDFQTVQMYYEYSEQEIEARENAEKNADINEILPTLPDSVAELSSLVSDNTEQGEIIIQAIAELSELVSQLMMKMEGE